MPQEPARNNNNAQCCYSLLLTSNHKWRWGDGEDDDNNENRWAYWLTYCMRLQNERSKMLYESITCTKTRSPKCAKHRRAKYRWRQYNKLLNCVPRALQQFKRIAKMCHATFSEFPMLLLFFAGPTMHYPAVSVRGQRRKGMFCVWWAGVSGAICITVLYVTLEFVQHLSVFLHVLQRFWAF